MVEFFESIPEHLIKWILKQQVFWVATAPLTADGHINLSPKGVEGSFNIINANRVWYEDLSGSGAETIAHIRENGRITVLFNAFEGPPRIARLFGRGTIHEFGTPEYDSYIPPETRKPGSRAVILIDVFKVSTSCGYAVPFYKFTGHRSQLLELNARKEGLDRSAEEAAEASGDPSSVQRAERSLKRYWAEKNKYSLDGLPELISAADSPKRFEECKTIFKKDDITQPRDGVNAAQFLKSFVDSKVLVGFFLGMLVTTVYVNKLARVTAV
ncbi:hypothetical protein HGRIS_014541 [Hohenbuehelia grisea]|uniref:Pyridoxamine 5'-phosphate oxidase N-terminal domain-containing protein n=1 Tax=Hohenbuehelia grisea TaxID=104357 RepID=A0ABR3JTR6_9AGAR